MLPTRRVKQGLLVACLLALGVGAAMAEVMQRRDWRVDASQGTFSNKVDIVVPAFQGIAPKLGLTYDSSIQGGWMGAGWSLDGPSRIERASPGRGAPRYDSTDIYLLDGQELVACAGGSVSPSCTTGGTHSTKLESYSRIALSGSGVSATWTVTAKDGTRSVFSPVYLVSGNTAVFKWGLSQVIDTKGNTVTYTWATNQFGCCWEYPDQIAYNGTTVKFHFETRPDKDWGALGTPGFTTQWGRLKTIDVKVSGTRVRAYKLVYTTSSSTNKSLLQSVQQFGKDATVDGAGTVTGGTSLPALTVAYQAGSTSFVAGSLDTSMANNANHKYLAMDIDGDGKTDMVEFYTVLTEYYRKTWLSNGTSFVDTAWDGGIGQIGYNANTRFFAGDFNGDGKSDFIEMYPPFLGIGKWQRHIWWSNGTRFTSGPTGAMAGDYSNNVRHLVMDVNGDGKSDLVELYQYGTTYRRKTWISNGSDFTGGLTEDGIGYNTYAQFLPMDVNGDSRSDLVVLYQSGLSWGRRVWLSNGSNGFNQGNLDTSMTHSTSGRYIAADINGDGKSDMLELFPWGGAFYRRAWLSNGYGFTQSSNDYGLPADNSTTFVVADVNGDSRDDFIELYRAQRTRRIWLSTSNGGFTLGATDVLNINASAESMNFPVDMNGDGLQDVVELYPGALSTRGRRVWRIGGSYPDLLTSVTSDAGGTTTVSYTPSTAWTNTNNVPVMQTVSGVTVADGRGNSATTSYSYSGGLYDALERRFMGFRYEKEIKPCLAGESPCPYTETWLKQDYGSASRPERIDRRTGSGQLLAANVYDYTTNGATVPWTSVQTGSWEYTYINAGTACPGADCKRRYTNRTFNAYGEVTQEIIYGDYDTTGDEDTATTTFVPNTALYIVNKPADVKVHQGVGTAGALLKETLSYYDGAATWNQAPSAGLPTQVARWLSSPSSFLATKKEYDAWGNVTADENALGARTTYVFDATYHMFRTSETNALGQSMTATWDAACGAPIGKTDLNGQTTTMTYDVLCRLSTKTEPGGRFENHSWANLGNAATQYEQVERASADGTGNIWSRTYIDGLGRKWRTATKGPAAATGDIFVDTTYNARNREASMTAPYYWVSGQAQPTTYATTFGYDALDRLTRRTFADGAFQTKSYGLWSVTSTDELGRAKTDRTNAAGNRTGHDETVGGQIKTTTYAYDARQNLASSTDPSGNVTTYTTDSLGRRTQMVDPDLGTWTYEFDGASRMTAHTDGKGQRTTFGYDALDRKTSKTSNAGTGSAVTVTWTFDEARSGYYNVGGVTSSSDPAGTRTTDRDAGGRVARIVRTTGGASYTFLYGHDAGDRLLWTTYPDGGTQGTASSPLLYDGSGRLKSIPAYVTTALYSAEGKLTQVTAANGAVSTRTYSAQRGWLTAISTTKGAATLQNLAYTRNTKGLITQVTSPFANEGWTYAFDELDRLTTATNSSSSTYNQTLAYSAIGNITSNSRLGAYSYGSRPHAPTAAGANTYAYDAGGLMTSVSTSGTVVRTLTWNGDNRPATITSPGVSLSFAYDADGGRVEQVENGITRRYVGDDYEVQVGGSSSRYISVAGVMVARVDGATATFLHTDQQGSVQAETDASGAEVHRRVFRPFGEVISTAGPLLYEPRGFTGQRHDASGLVYLHARYYDPTLATFVSPDLIIDGTDTVGLNRFAYCGNDPVNRTDIEGTDSKDNNDGTKKPKTGNWVDRLETASSNNPRFAAGAPTIGEPGEGKLRYEFYQRPIGPGSHFKVNVYDEKHNHVKTYSLGQKPALNILGVKLPFVQGGEQYNDENPENGKAYVPAGTIYKEASSLQAFNDAYMEVVAPGGKPMNYSLGNSNRAMDVGVMALGEANGIFALGNPLGRSAAAYGFDNVTGSLPPPPPVSPPRGGGGSF